MHEPLENEDVRVVRRNSASRVDGEDKAVAGALLLILQVEEEEVLNRREVLCDAVAAASSESTVCAFASS